MLPTLVLACAALDIGLRDFESRAAAGAKGAVGMGGERLLRRAQAGPVARGECL